MAPAWIQFPVKHETSVDRELILFLIDSSIPFITNLMSWFINNSFSNRKKKKKIGRIRPKGRLKHVSWKWKAASTPARFSWNFQDCISLRIVFLWSGSWTPDLLTCLQPALLSQTELWIVCVWRASWKSRALSHWPELAPCKDLNYMNNFWRWYHSNQCLARRNISLFIFTIFIMFSVTFGPSHFVALVSPVNISSSYEWMFLIRSQGRDLFNPAPNLWRSLAINSLLSRNGIAQGKM